MRNLCKGAGLLLLLTFVSISACLAQDYARAQRMDLQAAVDYALKNNVQVMQSGLNVKMSDNDLRQRKYDFLPDLNASGTQSYNFGRSIDPVTNQFTTEPVRSNTFSVGSSLPIFNGFRTQNNLKIARLDYQAAQYDYERAKNDLTLNVIAAYTSVLLNREQLAVADQQLQITEEQVDRTQKLVDAGSVARNNLLDLQSQLATDELSVVNTENNLAISFLNLKQLLNIPADEELEIVEPEIGDPDTEVYNVSASEVYQTAERTQPSILGADIRALRAERNISLAKSSYYPSLNLSYGFFTRYSNRNVIYNFGDPSLEPTVFYNEQGMPLQTVYTYLPTREVVNVNFMDQLDENLSQSLSVNLNIPIFNKFATRTQVANAVIGKESAELDAINARQQLRKTIEQAYIDMAAAAKTYISVQRQVTALEETFRSNQQRFDVGLLNTLEFNTAKTNLNRSRADLVRAKYDYVFKMKVLDFYQNKPISF